MSTINHSSAPKEIAHALKIVKPRLLIVDVAALDKVRGALASLDAPANATAPEIITMVDRVPEHSLVSCVLLVAT